VWVLFIFTQQFSFVWPGRALFICFICLSVILGRGVRVLLNILATAGAWENHYLVVVAVQGAPKPPIVMKVAVMAWTRERRPY
jgi:hypothetical protein